MRRSTLILPVIPKYDVFQLKKSYAKNFSLGFAVAVLIHILIIGAYFFLKSVSKSAGSEHRVITLTLSVPPSISFPADKQIAVSSPVTSLKNAIPIPVPDDKAANDKPVPTQNDLSGSLAQPGDIDGSIVKTIPPAVKVETPEETIPDIRGFTPYEKAPELIEHTTPVYPDLARRSGLEGNVYLRVLIGKNGRPLKAVVLKFDSEIFVKPSIDAAMKSVFTPAIQNKQPVMVWVTVPYKFRLNN